MASQLGSTSSPDGPTVRRGFFSDTRQSNSRSPERTDDDSRRIGLVHLSVLALIVGIVTGFGAVVFRDLIGLIHNALFLGQFAVRYDANLFTPQVPGGHWSSLCR